MQQAFSEFLHSTRYNEKQIRFVEMVIDHLTRNGMLDAAQLYEPPFNQFIMKG